MEACQDETWLVSPEDEGGAAFLHLVFGARADGVIKARAGEMEHMRDMAFKVPGGIAVHVLESPFVVFHKGLVYVRMSGIASASVIALHPPVSDHGGAELVMGDGPAPMTLHLSRAVTRWLAESLLGCLE